MRKMNEDFLAIFLNISRDGEDIIFKQGQNKIVFTPKQWRSAKLAVEELLKSRSEGTAQ